MSVTTFENIAINTKFGFEGYHTAIVLLDMHDSVNYALRRHNCIVEGCGAIRHNSFVCARHATEDFVDLNIVCPRVVLLRLPSFADIDNKIVSKDTYNSLIGWAAANIYSEKNRRLYVQVHFNTGQWTTPTYLEDDNHIEETVLTALRTWKPDRIADMRNIMATALDVSDGAYRTNNAISAIKFAIAYMREILAMAADV